MQKAKIFKFYSLKLIKDSTDFYYYELKILGYFKSKK